MYKLIPTHYQLHFQSVPLLHLPPAEKRTSLPYLEWAVPVREQTASQTVPSQLGQEVYPVLHYTDTLHYKVRIHMPRSHLLHQPNQGEPLRRCAFSIG